MRDPHGRNGEGPFERFDVFERDKECVLTGMSLTVGERVRVLGRAQALGPDDTDAIAAGASVALVQPDETEALRVTDLGHGEELERLEREELPTTVVAGTSLLFTVLLGAAAFLR